MTYVKTNWVDEGPPDIDAENLNKIEQGIFDAHAGVDAASSLANQAKADAASAVSTVNGHVASTSNPHSVTAKQVGGRHHKNAIKRGAVANGFFDNSTILQTLLDELAVSGGGELYLPNEGGYVYRTRGLWVPSNVRIVSEGATLSMIGPGPNRSDTGEPQAIYSQGCLYICPMTNAGYASVQRVVVDGLQISLASDFVEGMPVYGIVVGGGDVILRNLKVVGGRDPLVVGGRITKATDVRVLDSEFSGGTRNTISVTDAERVWIERNYIHGCTANSADEFDPGAGIDIEPDSASKTCQFIHVRGNHIQDCGGAGVNIEVTGWNGPAHCEGIIVEGNRIYDFGKNYNPVVGNGATRRDGVQLASTGYANEVVRVLGNQIHGGVNGAVGIRNGSNLRVIAIGNDVRGNAGGGLGGTFVFDSCNLTA